MSLPVTEARNAQGALDSVPAPEAAALALSGHQSALRAVEPALKEIATAADVIAKSLQAGCVLHYAAAGSSGLMALADCSELPGTFGIPQRSLRLHMAGGVPVDGHMPGVTEDDEETGAAAGSSARKGDAFVVLSASGRTQYAVAAARAARANGAKIIAIANNPNTPLLADADVSICLETPPEVVAGSTRLGAGTAQKAALNIMSSLMGVRLGHVYQGMMVNVVADNEKLRARAARIVAEISGVTEHTAQSALNDVDGHVKAAILVACGCNRLSAHTLLEQHKGHLGPCLNEIPN